MRAEMPERERGKWSGFGELADGTKLVRQFWPVGNFGSWGKQGKGAVRKRKNNNAGNTKKTEQSERNLRIWPGIDQGRERGRSINGGIPGEEGGGA